MNQFSSEFADTLNTLLPMTNMKVLFEGKVYLSTDYFKTPMRELKFESHVELVTTCIHTVFKKYPRYHSTFHVNPHIHHINGNTYIVVDFRR